MEKLNKYFQTIYLASQSPARKKVLEDEGLKVIARPVFASEHSNKKDVEEYIIEIAKQKMDKYLETFKTDGYPIIACDTLIYFNNSFIGKASNRDEAKNSLLQFSGKTHDVYTGYCLYLPNEKMFIGCDKAQVKFKDLSEIEIEEYLNENEWEGAAGSYRIQQKGKALIDKILGDYNTVVGLPLFKISDLIKSTLS